MPENNPLQKMNNVKVVILNWNGKPHLERFLPSVVENTPAGVEIIIADNGSDDGSENFICQKFPMITWLSLGQNYGYAQGYNRALESTIIAGAEYAVLLNSDVETSEGWLEPLIERMEKDSSIGAAAPKILSVEKPGYFEYAGAAGGFIDWFGYPFCRGRIMSATEQDNGQYDTAREVFWASGACMVVRMDAFRAAGGFDDDFFAHMEEIDLCWRMWARGWKVMAEPASKVYHLGGGTLNKENPRKLYLNYRNNLCMLYKNLSPKTCAPVVFIRMLLDGVSAIVYLLSGKREYYKAVLNAHRDYRKQKDNLRKKRKENMILRRDSPTGIYKGSIVLRYMFGCRKFGKMI